MKWFWLLADAKTVREISHAKFKELLSRSRDSKKTRYKLAIQHDGSRADLTFFDGTRCFFLPRAQLKQVLGENQPTTKKLILNTLKEMPNGENRQ